MLNFRAEILLAGSGGGRQGRERGKRREALFYSCHFTIQFERLKIRAVQNSKAATRRGNGTQREISRTYSQLRM